jgi:hypothetical protein
MLPASYAAVHRYDGAMLQRGQRHRTVACKLSGRDTAIVRDVWRYRFLTTDQLHALHFPGRTPQAVRRRLAKLFRAGHLERFRPYSRRGSYPWTYQLGQAGHRLLKEGRHIEPGARDQPRALHDYSYVIHDLQLNAWILAYRQLLDGTLVEWHGETSIHPPARRRRAQLALANDWTAEGLNDHSARPVVPDAVLEIKRPDGPWPWTFLLEHDRTRRVDKNFDKFRRYDTYLTAWHQDAGFARLGHDDDPPYVLFICQDHDQRQLFMAAADHELTGYRWHPATPDKHNYIGRQRILFATEIDIHSGKAEARRLPPYPPGHPARSEPAVATRGVRLPAPDHARRPVTREPCWVSNSPVSLRDVPAEPAAPRGGRDPLRQ